MSEGSVNYSAHAEQQQPTLSLLSSFLDSVTSALERAAEEKYLLLSKVRDSSVVHFSAALTYYLTLYLYEFLDSGHQ